MGIKQVIGIVLFIVCIITFVIAHRTKKKYLNEIKKMGEEASSEE